MQDRPDPSWPAQTPYLNGIGTRVVLEILRRVFRTTEEDATTSLSGKPVIITYLLEVVEQLKSSDNNKQRLLTEWDVYRLIIDQLMVRDLLQAGRIYPDQRRSFLQTLSVWLSQRQNTVITEEQFKELIREEFKNELRRTFGHLREQEVENYFEDLRRSGTLTRSTDPAYNGWKFSHNSLREFLLAEHLLDGLRNEAIVETPVPVTDAMRIFVASRGAKDNRALYQDLARQWGERTRQRGFGQLLVLLWDGIVRMFAREADPIRACLEGLSAGKPALNGITISRLTLSSEQVPTDLSEVSFASSEISDVDFSGGNYQRTDFSESILENVNFSAADLREAKFNGALLIDVPMPGAALINADFRGLDDSSSILIEPAERGLPLDRLEGMVAVGYLRYKKALTDEVDSYLVYRNYPKYEIVEKICRKLNQQSLRQRRGLEQRGVAQQDVRFARRFVLYLERNGLIRKPGGRPDMVLSTVKGRAILSHFFETKELPPEIEEFLRQT